MFRHMALVEDQALETGSYRLLSSFRCWDESMIIGQKYKRIKDDETNDREKDNSIPAFGLDNVELR